MRQIIIILLVLITCIPELGAQEQFDSALLGLEQQIFVARQDTEQVVLRLQKLDLYLSASIYSAGALREAKHINYKLIRSKAQQSRFLWNAALLAHMNEDIDYSLFYYAHYQLVSPDSTIPAKLLKIMINNSSDTLALSQSVKSLASTDTSFACLSCLSKVQSYQRKHKAWFVLSSVLVPGLGTALNGEPLKGMNSLLLNAATFYCIYALVENNLYINAFLFGGMLIQKFYLGNIRLTATRFEDKAARKKSMLAKNCEHALDKILSAYPVSYR
jgi:hypothetical protein